MPLSVRIKEHKENTRKGLTYKSKIAHHCSPSDFYENKDKRMNCCKDFALKSKPFLQRLLF